MDVDRLNEMIIAYAREGGHTMMGLGKLAGISVRAAQRINKRRYWRMGDIRRLGAALGVDFFDLMVSESTRQKQKDRETELLNACEARDQEIGRLTADLENSRAEIDHLVAQVGLKDAVIVAYERVLKVNGGGA